MGGRVGGWCCESEWEGEGVEERREQGRVAGRVWEEGEREEGKREGEGGLWTHILCSLIRLNSKR